MSRAGLCLIGGAADRARDRDQPGAGADVRRRRRRPSRCKLIGRVAWCTALFGAYQIGVKFVKLDDERARYLDMFVGFLDGTLAPDGELFSGEDRGARGRRSRRSVRRLDPMHEPDATARPSAPRAPPAPAPRPAHVGGGPHRAHGLHRDHARPVRRRRRPQRRPRARRGRGGRRVGLFLVLDDVETDTPPLWVKARVAWARAERRQQLTPAGVRFEVITDEQRAWLRQVLREISGPAALTGPSGRRQARGTRVRDARAVERGADDAARVAGALAARIEARERRRHQRRRDRAAGAPARWSASRPRPAGVGEQEAGQPRAQRRRPARSACGDEVGAAPRRGRRREPGPIAGRADRGAGAPARKSAEPLRRRAEPPAARAERRLLDPRAAARRRPAGRPPAGPKSSAPTVTTSPAFANGESRRDRLMPLTTTPSGSVAAGTIQPPGHMQKL